MFEKLLKAVITCEEVNECPLYICGMLCNTDASQKNIDFEVIRGGSGYICGEMDLQDTLEEYGIDTAQFEKELNESGLAFTEILKAVGAMQ